MHTTELDVGAVLDERYRITARLGTGGMSQVFLAEDDQLGREVAVKVDPASVIHDEDAARRRDEVTLLAGMSHPNLVVLYDAALGSEPSYLAMEYVAGETLADRLNRGPLDAGEATEIIRAVCEALAYMHARGVVHRDVKPANILLPERPAPIPAKLADFGIARLLDSGGVTAAGTIMGTAAYVSPEQVTARPALPASDIYALGLVLIESLTGRRVFPGTGVEAAAARLARDPDLGAAELVPFRRLLRRMTARDPRERPTAAEVADDLAGGAATRRMTAPDIATARLSARSGGTAQPARLAWLFAAAGTVLVAGVVALGLTSAVLPGMSPADDPGSVKVMPATNTSTVGDTGTSVLPAEDPKPASDTGNGHKGPKDKGPKNGKG